MKRIVQCGRTIAVLVVVFLLVGCGHLKAQADLESAIVATHARLAIAYSQCDADTFVAAYADTFTFITSYTPAPVSTTEGLRRYLSVGCSMSPNPTAEVVTQDIRTTREEAVVVGQYLFMVPSDGDVVRVPQNFTMILHRVGDNWLITAHHVSLIPQPTDE